MDQTVLQANLFASDLRDVRSVPAVAHRMNGSRLSELLSAIDPAGQKLELRGAAAMHFSELRMLVLAGFIQNEDRRRLLTLAVQLGIRPADTMNITFTDGRSLVIGPNHFRADPEGLHIFQFGSDAQLTRIFVPAAAVSRQEPSREDSNARDRLLDAALPLVHNAAELSLHLAHQWVSGGSGRSGQSATMRLSDMLVREHLVSEQQIHEAIERQKQEPRKMLGTILLEQHAVSENELYICLARILGVPFVKLQAFDFDQSVMRQIQQDAARRARAIPLIVYRESLVVAVSDPADNAMVDMLRFVTRRTILPVLATPMDIEWALGKHYAQVDHSKVIEQIATRDLATPSVTSITTLQALEAEAGDEPIVKLVNNLLTDAIARRASDIHLHPEENHFDLILRIDGTLVPVMAFPKKILTPVVSRIKIIGGMNISEHRLPQDGQIRFTTSDTTVDLRVSIMPTVSGESIVIRVLNTKVGMKPIDQLGFSEHDLGILKQMLDKSFGLFLVTGPTGSGKSTTLYSCLKELLTKNINIITVEDPVEYRIPGIEQVQVRSDIGYTFASALRQILRHDPDAILIGEIRDQETAEIAIKSALTGHVVLSTLHTNNAVGAITRLRDMGVLSYMLASTLLGVQAQRLIRTNCLGCMEEEEVDPRIRKLLDISEDELFMKGRGCDACNGTGYKGRSAVYELLHVTPGMQEKISGNAGAEALYRQALADNMVPLTQNAIELARSFKTSLAEAYRVRLD